MGENRRVIGSSLSPKPSPDGFWKTKKGFYFIWFLYLALSPSYELARRHNSGKLTNDDLANLPDDFDRVLAVYDDFGDVLHQDFEAWWDAKGRDLCAIKGRKPRVTQITNLKDSIGGASDASIRLNIYSEGNWKSEGRQNTVILAIPVGLSKSRIAAQVNAILDAYSQNLKTINYTKPKYSLAGQRQNKAALFRYLHVLASRACNPRKELWRIGAITDVSPKYSAKFNPTAKLNRKEALDERTMLAILTSRAYKRGLSISENAARGLFPCHKACAYATEPDLLEMRKRFMFVNRRKKRRRKTGI